MFFFTNKCTVVKDFNWGEKDLCFGLTFIIGMTLGLNNFPYIINEELNFFFLQNIRNIKKRFWL